MNEVPARLIVKLGPNPEKEYTLSQSEITIGRGSGNSIVIPNAEVSRRHAKIRREGNRYFIEDWGSTNGTFVSGQRVMGLTILHDGDKIRLADNIILQYIDEPINLNPPEEEHFVDPEPEVTIVDKTPPLPPPLEVIPEPQQTHVVNLQESAKDEFIMPDQQDTTSRNRRRLVGCGCIMFLIPLFCIGILLFLDFYQQGRFLYCGPIRPFFEIFLGPLGFAPICP